MSIHNSDRLTYLIPEGIIIKEVSIFLH